MSAGEPAPAGDAAAPARLFADRRATGSTTADRITTDRTIVIAEIAQAHDGSLGMAHAYIDAVAEAGADGVKFQTHLAAAESTARESWRRRFTEQDDSRFDYWRRMEFRPADWQALADHARARGLFFLSSPFSLEACDLLEQVGVAAWKVASGEVSNGPLFARMAASGLPLLISTGMSPWPEIDRAVAAARAADSPFAVLQCTSRYPTPFEEVGLNVLGELRERYGCPVGLSDHSGSPYAGLAAATLGAAVVEVHVAFSRQVFSPDLEVSLTVDELGWLCRGVAAIGRMRRLVDKDQVARDLQPMRELFTKSLVAARPLAAGDILAAGDLTLKKPGGGLPADQLFVVCGRRLRRPLAVDDALAWDDLEA